MTTTDHDDRLARLKAAKTGDTVTVPDAWEPPEACPRRLRGLKAGDTFTSDGTGIMQWLHERTRDWFASDALALAGLDVDQAGEPAGETAGEYVRIGEVSADGVALDPSRTNEECCGCADCAVQCHGCDACDPDDDDDDDRVSVGTVHVRVIPDTDGFVEKITKVAGEAADAIDAAGFHLDEYQRERVAALEQAVRVLESRRAPQDGKGAGIFAALTSPGTSVPMVGVQDTLEVAAFIADGTVYGTGVSA